MEPCKLCNGDKMLPIPMEQWPPNVFQPMLPCPCTQAVSDDKARRERRAKLNAVWADLSRTKPAAASPLKMAHLRSNLRLEANLEDLRGQVSRMARAALRARPNFCMRVCSDIDLITSWLYSANEVYDAEASAQISRANRADPVYRRLPDLINPPHLLVLRLGLKLAPNRALPDVVMETLLSRQHLNRPTWIVERVGDPLGARYTCYSQELLAFVKRWPQMSLSSTGDEHDPPADGTVELPAPRPQAPMKPSIDLDATEKRLVEGKPKKGGGAGKKSRKL